MPSSRSAIAVSAAVCLAAFAVGAPARHARAFTEESLECMGKAMSAKERLACAEAELAAQNRALATAVQRIRSTSDPRAVDLLNRSQHAWEAFRDANCNWMMDRLRREPEAQRIERILCLANTTEVRVQEIEEYQSVP